MEDGSNSNNAEETGDEMEDAQDPTTRTKLRQLTGFSLSAFRASMRAFTGLSLSAIYVATLTATGAWIRQLTRVVLSIFPPPVRYFLQPFLILYYAPLFIIRNLANNTRKRARKTHEEVVDGWRSAVVKAEDTVSYWPVHVDSEGNFEADGSVELNTGIAESVEVAMETNDPVAPPLGKSEE